MQIRYKEYTTSSQRKRNQKAENILFESMYSMKASCKHYAWDLFDEIEQIIRYIMFN